MMPHQVQELAREDLYDVLASFPESAKSVQNAAVRMALKRTVLLLKAYADAQVATMSTRHTPAAPRRHRPVSATPCRCYPVPLRCSLRHHRPALAMPSHTRHSHLSHTTPRRPVPSSV